MAAGSTDVFSTADRSVELNLNLSRRSNSDPLGQNMSCNWLQKSTISDQNCSNGYNNVVINTASSNYNTIQQLAEMEYLQSCSNYNYWASSNSCAGGINYATASANSLIWPPRSYSCNFCHRRFRSAQALGGHMNVHRRDRAKLYQNTANSPASASAATAPSPSPSPSLNNLASDKLINFTKNSAAAINLSNGVIVNNTAAALPRHKHNNPENLDLMQDHRRTTCNTALLSTTTSSSSPSNNYNNCNYNYSNMQISDQKSTTTYNYNINQDESNLTDLNNTSDEDDQLEDEQLNNIDLELRLGQSKNASNIINQVLSVPNPNPNPTFLKRQRSYIIDDDDDIQDKGSFINILN